LRGNDLSDEDLSQMLDLPNLKGLDLSRNNLTSIPPKILSNRSLKTIDITFNRIEELPEEIGF